MKTNPEEVQQILELTEVLAQEYLKKNKGRNIKNLKERIKDLLINQSWDIDIIYELSKKLKKLNVDSNEIDSLWKAIEEVIEISYTRHLKSKSHIYDGRIRVYEKRLIELLVDAGKLKSQNAVFSSIIGYLLLHGSLTQSQLKELTGFSKGAISQSLKLLSNVPIINKESIEGTRENVYSFGASMADIASNIGSYKSESNQLAISFLRSKAEELNKHRDKNGYQVLSNRIANIINYFEYNAKLIKKIEDSSFITDLKEEKS